MYDLIVKNGTVIDPYQNFEERRDIAVSEGKVISVEEEIASTAKRVVEEVVAVLLRGVE